MGPSAGVEALARLDTATRDRLFGDAWPLMWGMRNRIAHGYLLVDTDIVRRTLEHDIPPILTRIDAELTDAGQPSQHQGLGCCVRRRRVDAGSGVVDRVARQRSHMPM